jgi:hypothetical protein
MAFIERSGVFTTIHLEEGPDYADQIRCAG